MYKGRFWVGLGSVLKGRSKYLCFFYRKIESTVSEPNMEFVQDPIIDPIVESVQDPVSESVQDPIIESVQDPTIDPIMESVQDPIMESVQDPIIESVQKFNHGICPGSNHVNRSKDLSHGICNH